ncbi:MAG: hypothetical protein ACJ731_12810 [Vicinamibacterales bacterium]
MDEKYSSTDSTGLIDKVRQGATSQLGVQKNKATDGIGTVAHAVRQASQQLRTQQHETIASYIDQAANQLERFSTHLRDKDAGELVRDAQQFAKRRPAVFIGSAFAIGLLGARFLKSSRAQQYGGNGGKSYGGSSTGYTAGYGSATTIASSPGTGGSNAAQR